MKWGTFSVAALYLSVVSTAAGEDAIRMDVDSSNDDAYQYLSFEDVVDGVQSVFDPSHVITFTLNAREKFCFYEEITEEEIAEAHLQQTSTIDGALFASGGRNHDIKFDIYDPEAELLYSSKIKKEGTFSEPMTKEGTYEFCFSNEMSVRSKKKITLALHFEKPKASPEHLQTEDLLPVGVASDAVYSKLDMVNKELRFLKLRYAEQRSSQMKTLDLSTKFGVLEGLAVIVVAILQVLYIQHIVSSATRKPILG